MLSGYCYPPHFSGKENDMNRKDDAAKKDDRQTMWVIILVVVAVLGSALYSIKQNIRCDREHDPISATRVGCN